jgi:hypothetical protein
MSRRHIFRAVFVALLLLLLVQLVLKEFRKRLNL